MKRRSSTGGSTDAGVENHPSGLGPPLHQIPRLLDLISQLNEVPAPTPLLTPSKPLITPNKTKTPLTKEHFS